MGSRQVICQDPDPYQLGAGREMGTKRAYYKWTLYAHWHDPGGLDAHSKHHRPPRGRYPFMTARYPGLNRCLLMPRLAIFDSSVCRGIPSLAAAPDGPEIRPSLPASAASIISFSRSRSKRLRLPPCTSSRVDAGDNSRFSHASSTVNVSVSHRMTARSMTFCSSRMLPGQSYASKSFMVLPSIVLIFFAALLA